MAELNFILAVFLKPAVLLLDDLLLIPLWGIRHIKGVKLFMISIALFFAGELFCARDVYILRRMTFIDEASHDISMMLAFGMALAAFFYMFQGEIGCLKERCPVILKCPQRNYSPVFISICLLLLGVASAMPVFAKDEVLRVPLEAGILGRHIAVFIYDRTLALSILQQKIFPALGSVLLFIAAGAFFVLKKSNRLILWVIFLGLGAMGFSYFRLVLVHFFHPQATLTAFWEEVLELSFIISIFLWIRTNKNYGNN